MPGILQDLVPEWGSDISSSGANDPIPIQSSGLCASVSDAPFCPFASALNLANRFLRLLFGYWHSFKTIGSPLLLTGPWQNIWSGLVSETLLPAVENLLSAHLCFGNASDLRVIVIDNISGSPRRKRGRTRELNEQHTASCLLYVTKGTILLPMARELRSDLTFCVIIWVDWRHFCVLVPHPLIPIWMTLFIDSTQCQGSVRLVNSYNFH